MKSNQPKRYRFGSIVIIFIIVALISWFLLNEIFVVTGTFAGIVIAMWLFMRWDDMVIWWYTRGKKKS